MKKIVFVLCAIIITAAACSKKTSPSSNITAINAASVFGTNCSRCHGVTGVEGRAPNLSKSTLEKDSVIARITNGKDHMPAFHDKLSQQEISAVADWVMTL